MTEPRECLSRFVARAHAAGQLVLQPRMGFGDPRAMRAGLEAVKAATGVTVGTVTLDSYTRVGHHAAAAAARRAGIDLNGYPLVAHGARATRGMLDGVADDGFPVQVRHGSPLPLRIFRTLLAAGLDATEGGPVSYCLPYSRVPLSAAVEEWWRCCDLLAAQRDRGVRCHLETFGGCMLGQLAPPALLVALSVLEALFFQQRGVPSVSVSYAQQTSTAQDVEAVGALRRLAGELLVDVDWHVVVYSYMGMYPRTPAGARRLLAESVRLAVLAGAERLVVKTVAESSRIPTIAENVAALEAATAVARRLARAAPDTGLTVTDTGVYAQARFLVDMVRERHHDVGRGLLECFRRGWLDVPYCLHPDNHNQARAVVDGQGRLQWAALGRVPLPRELVGHVPAHPVTARGLLRMLAHHVEIHDALDGGAADAPSTRGGLGGGSAMTTGTRRHQGTGLVLADVRQRGHLRAGVSRGLLGLSWRDGSGRWRGLDVDVARAVAAAVLGDARRVDYVPLDPSERLDALAEGRIDLLVANASWTLGREAAQPVTFAGVTYYDGEGFLVRRASGVRTATDLAGARLGIQAGTTSRHNLDAYFGARDLACETVEFATPGEALAGYARGDVDAYVLDRVALAAERARLDDPDRHVLLPDTISKEPMGPAVPDGDSAWLKVVRWVLLVLVAAEEEGLRSADLGHGRPPPAGLVAAGVAARPAGLGPTWACDVVHQVGNYGELFDRNLGPASGLGVARGPNALWADGGLMYAPPLH